MTSAQKKGQLVSFQEEQLRRLRSKWHTYFPDCLPGCTPRSGDRTQHVVRPGFTTPICRVLYPRSLLFFAAGRFVNRDTQLTERVRLFLAANRVSKTESAAFEITSHVTGAYKPWWPGKTFEGPTDWWVAGDTRETTRDVPQKALFGQREHLRDGSFASGMVPAHLIVDHTLKPGVADCLDMVYIQHKERVHGAPALSKIQFKSYDQGRKVFQGAQLSGGFWLDEEPPDAADEAGGGGEASGAGDIYTECRTRIVGADGIGILTFTPLRGLTPFVDRALDGGLMVDLDGRIVNAKIGIFGDQREAS